MEPTVGDLAWLDALDRAGEDEPWAPRTYEFNLILLHPWMRLTQDAGTSRAEPWFWCSAAAELGAQMDSHYEGLPHWFEIPPPLQDAMANGTLDNPDPGTAPAALRAILAEVLGRMTTPSTVTIGIYTGGYGNVAAPWAPVRPLLRTVGDLEYLFMREPAGEFLRRWPTDEFDVQGVAFVWPEDRSWFYQSNPDRWFSSLSCARTVAEVILADDSIEHWIGDPSGPWGRHLRVPVVGGSN